jgi:hypothetical protein
MGIPEMICDLQTEINRRRSQMMDNANRMGNQIWVVDNETGLTPDMNLNDPAGHVVMKRGMGKVQRLSTPELPQWLSKLGYQPFEDAFMITGTGGAMGNVSAGKRSGSAVAEAAAHATQRIRKSAKSVDAAIKSIARKYIDYVQRFWTTPRWVRAMGSWREATPIPFNGRQARGQWDIRIESGSASANSKLARRQEAFQLMALGIIGPMHLMEALDWPNRETISREMGYGRQQILPNYPGWPSLLDPLFKNTGESTGYSLAARYQPPAPPTPQLGPGQMNIPTTAHGGGPRQRAPKMKQNPRMFSSPSGFPTSVR